MRFTSGFASLLIVAFFQFSANAQVGKCADETSTNCPLSRTLPTQFSEVVGLFSVPAPSLNAPGTASVSACRSNSDGQSCDQFDEASCDKAICEADAIVAKVHDQPAACQCNECEPACLSDEASDFCVRLSDHLSECLERDDLDQATRKRAILTALKLVAERSETSYNRKLSKIEFANNVERSRMRSLYQQLSSKKEVPASVPELNRMVEYQARTLTKLENLTLVNQSIFQRLAALEQKVDVGDIREQARKNFIDQLKVDDKSLRIAREREIQKLLKEIEVLDSRIRNLQSSEVRPATHLEPIFSSEDRLLPIAPIKR